MPKAKMIEPELKKIYMPVTADLPNEDERFWVVLDISPQTGRELIHINGRDSTGTTMLKGVVSRLSEWNYQKEDGSVWPIDIDNVGSLMSMSDISFLSNQIKQLTAATALSDAEKKG